MTTRDLDADSDVDADASVDVGADVRAEQRDGEETRRKAIPCKCDDVVNVTCDR